MAQWYKCPTDEPSVWDQSSSWNLLEILGNQADIVIKNVLIVSLNRYSKKTKDKQTYN